MSERMLITKLVLEKENRVALYGKGHRYKDLTLFDASDLADFGIDYAALQPGQETPCRFWALWEASDKLNQKGNPYKDVVALEPIDKPATTTSVDNSAVLAELRAIHTELQRVNGLLAQALDLDPVEPEEVPAGDVDDELPAVDDHPEAASDEPPGPAPRPLNDAQARRLATKRIGEAVRSKQISPEQANEITRLGSVENWRNALSALETLLEPTT